MHPTTIKFPHLWKISPCYFQSIHEDSGALLLVANRLLLRPFLWNSFTKIQSTWVLARGAYSWFSWQRKPTFSCCKKLNGRSVLKVPGKLITWSSQAFTVTFTAFVQLSQVVWSYREIHNDLTRRVWCRISIAKRIRLTLQDVITGINIIYKLPSAELFDTDS